MRGEKYIIRVGIDSAVADRQFISLVTHEGGTQSSSLSHSMVHEAKLP